VRVESVVQRRSHKRNQKYIQLNEYMCVCVCVCTQSSQTFCDPMDYSPSGYSIYGIFQARMLE